MARKASLAHRLYAGELSYDFVGHRRRWYLASGIVILVAILSLLVRGINPSIEFKGGDLFQFPSNGHSLVDVNHALATVPGLTIASVQTIGENQIQVQTESLSTSTTDDVQKALATGVGVGLDQVTVSTVGPTWGSEVTTKSIEGLVIFLIVVVLYLAARFGPKMAIAAIVALLHDIVITAGIYSLVGFQVSPATVIALLTILGYSLYDTVVVFDKVRENTQGLASNAKMTFSQAANLAINQTLVRSINTSVIALLPVAALLIIGAGLLGAGTLKDLALALFIGLATGAYSSIFIATPLLCDLREREPAMRQLSAKVAQRDASEARAAQKAQKEADKATVPSGGSDESAVATEPASARGARPSRPPQRAARKKRR